MNSFDVITLFPSMFSALHHGVVGRAIERGLIEIHTHNPRDFTEDKYHTVDDKAYGGGPGMVMKYEPLACAILAAKKRSPINATVIYLSPQGKRLNQKIIKKLSEAKRLILISGRYEGIDERVIENFVDDEYSIGDYVLSGGELPTMVLIDAISRLIPGVLGDEQSAEQDSFNNELLDCPHYTRPEQIDNKAVPEVLLQGNHQAIAKWRLQQSLGRTWLRRPDLLQQKVLTKEEQQLLSEFIESRNKAKGEPEHEYN